VAVAAKNSTLNVLGVPILATLIVDQLGQEIPVTVAAGVGVEHPGHRRRDRPHRMALPAILRIGDMALVDAALHRRPVRLVLPPIVNQVVVAICAMGLSLDNV